MSITVTTITWNQNIHGFSIADLQKVEDAIDDMNFTLTVDNDGIGPYEFWGHCGFDHGNTYLILEDVEPVEIEIEKGIVAPHSAIQELLDNLCTTNTLTKTCWSKHARHEDDCFEMELEAKLVHKMEIKGGKLIVKLWYEEN